MRKRAEDSRDAGTRLVYSTGGEAERPRAVAPVARATGGKGIRLRLGGRPGGPGVTLVLGLAGSEDELAALAKAPKSEGGTGGTAKEGSGGLQGGPRAAA